MYDVAASCARQGLSSGRPRATRNLQKMKSGLVGLQVIEIDQYRQGNLWNSLQKKALNLQKIAKKLQKGLEERGGALG